MAALMLFITLILMGFYTYADNETGGRAEFRYTFESSSYFNGLLFALYTFYFAVLIVLPIFTAAEGGAQLTSETAGGTIQGNHPTGAQLANTIILGFGSQLSEQIA